MRFEKISFKQFKQDCIELGYFNLNDSEIDLRERYDEIKIPKRSTKGSAGYDFYTPFNIVLNEEHPHQMIPLGIRVVLDPGCVLLLLPKSGLGFKTGMYLSNTIGVIDSDYQYADNEGHIMAKFEYGFKECKCMRGEKVMQGIVMRFETVEEQPVESMRTGGFGSTGK